MSSTVSKKGLRCSSLNIDCTDKPFGYITGPGREKEKLSTRKLIMMLIFFLSILLFTVVVNAADYGPYDITVTRVIDGDTIKADIHIWPDLTHNASIRVRGVNTPETRTRSDCERDEGLAAKAFVQSIIDKANTITIDQVSHDKYGRVLARVLIDGNDLTQQLITTGHGIPYNGERRGEWECKQ